MRLVTRRFHLYRTNFVLPRKEEIDFIVMLARFRRESVIIQLIALRFQHLRHYILIQIAKIGAQLVVPQLLIDDILSEVLVTESQCDKKTRVSKKHLITIEVFVK